VEHGALCLDISGRVPPWLDKIALVYRDRVPCGWKDYDMAEIREGSVRNNRCLPVKPTIGTIDRHMMLRTNGSPTRHGDDLTRFCPVGLKMFLPVGAARV
jgi:hypothetical protein